MNFNLSSIRFIYRRFNYTKLHIFYNNKDYHKMTLVGICNRETGYRAKCDFPEFYPLFLCINLRQDISKGGILSEEIGMIC